MKPVRSLPQVIEMLLTDDEFIHRRTEYAIALASIRVTGHLKLVYGKIFA